MPNDYEKLFSYLESPEPPEGLFGKIMSRIRRERQIFILRRRLVIFSIGAIGSVIALIPSFRAVQAELAQSGFTQFFSLVFSDFATVAALWKDFAFSILEALPVMSLAAFLAAVFVFLGSVKFLVRDITAIFSQPPV